MAKKNKSAEKAARKERARAAKEAKKQAQEAHQQMLARRRQVSALILAATFLLAAVSYWGLDDRQLTGVALLVGGIVFLLYSMGTLGAGVKPRDRHRAGSIDFGTRD